MWSGVYCVCYHLAKTLTNIKGDSHSGCGKSIIDDDSNQAAKGAMFSATGKNDKCSTTLIQHTSPVQYQTMDKII